MQAQFTLCEHCGAVFTPRPDRVGRFCAIACWYAYRRAQSWDDRFWAKVDTSAGINGCWRRAGALNEGYASWRPSQRGHQFAFISVFGEPPPHLPFIIHKCPGGANRWCVNPAHLAPGTGKENAEDRKRDGAQVIGDHRGERNGRSKLTAAKAVEIRQAHAAGTSQYVLACQHGITQASVSALILRKTWRHV